jgi:glycosyltransferase involved in cell wall biosynthesis
MALITFVTTCRGRLAHLRETLPLLAAQPDAAVIVVDYGCPENSGKWVEETFPQVEVVHSGEVGRFELARARNIGAARAQSQWICFVDADIRLDPAFSERVRPRLVPGHHYRAYPRTIETYGTCICTTADFERIGGYDEVIQGWGKEDEDFYARLVISGLRYATFPGELLSAMRHSETDRVAHYDVKDRWVSESINHVYCRAKIDRIVLQHGPMGLNARKRLYTQIRAAVIEAHDADKPVAIALPIRTEETRMCGTIRTKLVYTLAQPRGDGRPRKDIGSVIPKNAATLRLAWTS